MDEFGECEEEKEGFWMKGFIVSIYLMYFELDRIIQNICFILYFILNTILDLQYLKSIFNFFFNNF